MSGEPKVVTNVKNKKGKKVTEVKIKFDKNKHFEGKSLEVKMKNQKKAKKFEKVENMKMKGKSDENKVESEDKKIPQHLVATTQRVLSMVEQAVKAHQPAVQTNTVPEKHKMEMMKVKKAVDPIKKADLEHDLLKDYPENGTVEVVNWEGTFAPIHGEPYVAPLHHQPDSFWDAIYRSTDPDLPTPPGVDISFPQPTTQTYLQAHLNAVDLDMKGKDKGNKKEKKKPKLSPKEKKQKKRDKKENPNNLARAPGPFKLSDTVNKYTHFNLQTTSEVEEHNVVNLALHSKGGLHSRFTPHKPAVVHAGGKSEETLKTPSEEERESGTTYKPEGAYEYPSFRHPDFNPETAYDDNGIPIHESPGWTPPPTLPGDHRFGKERSRAGAGLAGRVQDHGLVTLAKPHLAQTHDMDVHHPQLAAHENHAHKDFEKLQDLHKGIAAQEHRHLAEALGAVHVEPSSSEKSDATKHLLDHQSAGQHSIPALLLGQHHGATIKDHKIQKRAASESVSKEFLDNVKKSIHHEAQRDTAKDYKAYRLTDSELLEKEDSAPLEALNPALYMHRNMLKARKKRPKHPLDKIPDSAEVIAVIVSPRDGKVLSGMGKMDLHKIHKIPFTQGPVVYNKDKEARNPLLYKHRNMFKVSDLKDDGLKFSKDVLRQTALNNPRARDNTKGVPLEDFLKDSNPLKGKGRENFHPIFINRNKLFRVSTNKFKAASVEHYIVKREVKESENPHLYSYQNIFSSNPKQILPLKNNQMKAKQEQAPPPQSRFTVPQDDLDPSKVQGRLFNRGVPVIDADSEESALDPKVKQYMGKNKEAANPYLVNYPNMFAMRNHNPLQTEGQNLDGNAKADRPTNSLAKPNKPLDPDVMKYVGRNKENLNPYLYKYPNLFTVNSKTARKEAFPVKNTLPLHKVQQQKGGVNAPLPLFAQKQLSGVPANKCEGHNIQKRELDKKRKNKLKLNLAGKTPGAGRPKSLKRKTKDDEDSFASYFEGVDPTVVEEEEPSTVRPQVTTDVDSSRAGSLSSNIIDKKTVRREKLIQTNAAILHRLTKAMRPKWRKELEALDLSPHNTTVEFTDSMQEEIRDVIERKLLNGPPQEDAIDELTQDLYHLVEMRERQNKSVGHIMLGVEPTRDPLVRGTIHVAPGGERGRYHLQYRPQDDPGELRELNGTLNLQHLKVDLSHRSAGSKLLRSILTVRPRELSHSEADEVLSQIFTKPTTEIMPARKVKTPATDMESPSTKRIRNTTETSKKLFESQQVYDLLQNDPSYFKEIETGNMEMTTNNKQSRPTTTEPETTTKQAVTLEMTTNNKQSRPTTTEPEFKKETFPYYLSETTTKQAVTLEMTEKYLITTQLSVDLVEEFNKLRETISKSKNISATLMEEMEACERKKDKTCLEKAIKPKSEGNATPFGSWKLQQRIRDFKPQKPFPTTAPFVRKWPTFRAQGSVVPATPRPTLLTMRPKYGGPRHEPFFFNDFQRIRTVYPTTMMTITPPTETTKEPIRIDKLEKEIFEVPLKSSYTPETKTTIVSTSFAPDILSRAPTKRRYFSWVHQLKNDSTFNSFYSFTTTELPVHEEVRPTTTDYNYKGSGRLFRPSSTTGKPYVVELKVSNKVFTVRPIFIRTPKPRQPTIPTTHLPTTRRSHIHAIKHTVKTGLKKFFSFFGFGKSSKEEQD